MRAFFRFFGFRGRRVSLMTRRMRRFGMRFRAIEFRQVAVVRIHDRALVQFRNWILATEGQ